MTKLIQTTWCSAALSLFACAAPRPAARPAQPEPAVAATAEPIPSPAPALALDGPIEVTLRVEAITREGHGFIESDKGLRSGDQIALHVGVKEPAYIYIGLASAGGGQSLLFPRGSASELLSPDSVRRIPQPGQWFRLDKDAGREDIFVYASRTPLTGDEVLTRLRRDSVGFRAAALASAKPTAVAAARPRPRPSANDAPGKLSADDRGLDLVDDKGADVQTDGGVTRAHFRIRHAK